MTGNQSVIEGRKKTEGREYFWLSSTPIFSNEQCSLLRSLVDADNSPALIEGNPDYDTDTSRRRTKIFWLIFEEHKWVYEIISSTAQKANALFEFDVVPMQDTIQLALYDADEEGYFDWHTDIIASDLTRKISISVPLNNSDEFEGGKLEFKGGGASQPPQRAGCPVMFPSWLIHRVTPVTKGKRYSLVAWIRGPNWR